MAKKYYWRCQCGEQFLDRSWEYGYFDYSPTGGCQQAASHQNLHKRNGDPEKIEGLYVVDDDGQEYLVFEGFNWGVAVKEGILPPSKAKQGSSSSDTDHRGGTSPAAIGEIYPVKIGLPALVLFFYELDRASYPDAYPDRSQETMGRWLTECVVLAHMVNPRRNFVGLVSYIVNLALALREQVAALGQASKGDEGRSESTGSSEGKVVVDAGGNPEAAERS